MRSLDIGRNALSSCAAAALLAGCGGSQPPIGGAGATPQSHFTATQGDRSGSWMLSEAASQSLLYGLKDISLNPGNCQLDTPSKTPARIY